MGDTQQQGNTGGTTDAQQGTEQGTGQEPQGQQGGEPQGTTWTPPASQEELDRIVQDRIARERKKFEGYVPSDRFNQAITDAKSEGEREAAQRFTTRLLQAEVKAGARGMGFHDPNDAIQQLGDLSDAVKDGEVDADAVSKALTKLATDKPYLVNAETGTTVRTRSRVRRTTDNNDTAPTATKARAADALRQFAAGR